MSCPLCDDTGWKPVVDPEGTAPRRVVRCDCWRENVGRQRLADANIPKRYQHCTLANFTAYNESLERAVAQASRLAESFPAAGRGPVPRRTAWRRQDPSGRRGPQAGDPVRRSVGAVLRHPRPAPRHPQHLRSVDQDDRTRSAAAGDESGPAGARRPRRGEDVRVGRRDDEPHRQHPVQRAAADDLHVELPDIPDDTEPNSLLFRIGHRMRSRLHEMCEFVEMDGADYREMPANGGVDDLDHALEDAPKGAAGADRTPGARPAPRTPRQRRKSRSEVAWRPGRQLARLRATNSCCS